MYVLYTTQSRLRISAPFYLILWNADHAIPFAYLCAILFNFHKMPLRNPQLRVSISFYLIFKWGIILTIKKSAFADFFILSCAGAAVWIGRLDITAG